MPDEPAVPADEPNLPNAADCPCLRRLSVAYLIEHLMPDNPRVISSIEYEQLKRQLDDGDTGNLQPVTFNVRTGHVISGNQRVTVYDDLGVELTAVWCVDISEEAERKAVLALNNHAGRYDDAALKEIMAQIAEDAREAGDDVDLSLAATGFTADELLELIDRVGQGGAANDPSKEWTGMPEFNQEDKTAWKSVLVNFRNQDDLDAFAALIKQTLTLKTRSVWFPVALIERYMDKEYTTNATTPPPDAITTTPPGES